MVIENNSRAISRHDSRLIKIDIFIYFTHFWQLYNFHLFFFLEFEMNLNLNMLTHGYFFLMTLFVNNYLKCWNDYPTPFTRSNSYWTLITREPIQLSIFNGSIKRVWRRVYTVKFAFEACAEVKSEAILKEMFDRVYALLVKWYGHASVFHIWLNPRIKPG